ncbi:hypothetical protein [Anabaenopsis arnoldii]|uniref:Uncharacterized protein n=1 Tax=Anabaenopsis arnoldii TaxID=2152938 RepID=A0ABT5AVZ6_9CYAN|nr:hypothetical protein [Anabaenopsis arnoldii]MDB9540883.1 hypothetical protein [Anabaenopsis arnoldii]MDH6093321.1 hypothetical protein [Anabaenopsis arnoldii]
MNKLTLSLILLMSYGCSQPLFNSRSAIAPVTSPSDCSQTSKVNLNQQNITEVVLDEQMLVKSGRVTATEAVGYRFDAQPGQTFTYNTNDDICIVVYTPDNQIITSGELPTRGKYILQVSSPQNDRAFGLGMSLTSPVVEDIPETPTPEPTTVNTASTSPTTNQTTVKNTPRRTKTRRPRPVKTARSSPTTNQTTVNDTPSAETPEPTTVDTASSSTTDQTTVNDTPSAETPEPTTVDTASSSTTDQTTVNDTPTTETRKSIPIPVPSNSALVSQSVSSPSRPPADDFVRNHYTALNNRQYDQTWTRLSPQFKGISGDFSKYQEWWDSVAEIRIGNVELISQNSDRAVVDAQLWYEMNNGRVAEDKKTRISLMWSDEANSWLFVRKSSP